ncbi:ribonuclease D [Notoacmeibacter marinus]|uniref:Ribonuclease D n=1 Tax=Notoacmeibacter marinus TaxID=1876515 RepID=A0A231UZX3_9HYPH|nr:ribonuclease D [Notoacmeibacter marinus]OXT01513.1 ribonuclease D [Notoacmeibacter marinus]
MQIITETDELEAAMNRLSRAEFVTVDTEFIRETTFWPELCLIQIADDEDVFLIDALAQEIDLSSFFGLMGDESVIKVFHAARQDLEIVYKMGELIPHPIFDTQIAAMVCGYGDSVSYDALVQKVTGKQLDKSSRFTDWRRRPLSEKQLNYAAADVTHLRDVYRELKQTLERTERTHWVAEEMDILTSPATYDIKPEDAWRRLKMRVRKPRELAVMQSVARWREEQARGRNVPRGRVLKDDAIYEIAQQQPQTQEALGRLRAVPKGWERSQHAQGLLDAVNAALAIADDELPKIERQRRSPEGAGAASELLKVLLRLIAEREGVAPKVLATTDEIEKIASMGEQADVQALSGWRRDVFGVEALRLLSGDVGLAFRDRKIAAIDL